MKQANFIGCIIALAPMLILLILVGSRTDWQFIYTLDDPYIHLALAKGIHNFHYGINNYEYSAPSSSILWPFLLAPWASIKGFWLTPLIINLSCFSGTVLLAQRFISQNLKTSPLHAWTLSSFAAFCLNIYGLVFTGMEHSLQILLVTIIAVSLANQNLSRSFWVSIFLLPLIRYEGLAISLPVLIYTGFQGEITRSRALMTGTLLLVSLLLFTAFLWILGLGYLPSSVFAKQSATTVNSFLELGNSLAGSVKKNISSDPTLTILIFAFFSSIATWSRDKFRILILLIAPTALHLGLGSTGWWGRYEVYILWYVLIIATDLLIRRSKGHLTQSVVASASQNARLKVALPKKRVLIPLLLIFFIGTQGLWQKTRFTAAASKNIYDQQVQMALIASEYLNKPVAVNDLGAVALSSKQYVLDLWGLGSYEALSLRREGSDPQIWIPQLMNKKKVDHAIVYDKWFPIIPDNWIKVAELKLPGKRLTPASSVVSFYSTSQSSAKIMLDSINKYISDHKSKAKMIRFFYY